MITMKKARRMCPSTPTVREPLEGRRNVLLDSHGRIFFDQGIGAALSVQAYRVITPKTLTEPFRDWARKEFKGRRDLSPKLASIVQGG